MLSSCIRVLRSRSVIQVRSLSQFASIIETDNCQNFCNEVVKRFASAKLGEISVPSPTLSRWQDISSCWAQLSEKRDELVQLSEMDKETTDAELQLAIKQDTESVQEALDELTDSLAYSLVPKTEFDVLSKCQLEFASGAGGVESMIFANEVYNMYRQYAAFRGWLWTPLQCETVPNGGLRSAFVLLEGPTCYADMRFEAGVHRVQRVPFNASIMHTSTISLVVLPEPENVEMIIPTNELKIETMRASGPGGQNVNQRSTACRITHLPTGIQVHCMEDRFQYTNIQIARKKLAAILMQQKVDDVSSKTASARRLQFGSRARAEKIRTYNFKDDRVTDHRLKMSSSHLEGFLKGGEELDTFVSELKIFDLKERLVDVISSPLD